MEYKLSLRIFQNLVSNPDHLRQCITRLNYTKTSFYLVDCVSPSARNVKVTRSDHCLPNLFLKSCRKHQTKQILLCNRTRSSSSESPSREN